MNSNPPSGRAMQIISRLACVGISATALIVIFQWVDLPVFIEVISNVHLGWLAGAVGLFGVAMGLAAVRWHIVLSSSGLAVHPWATVRTVFIAHLFNTFLFGPAGGDVAKSMLYGRWYQYRPSAIFATCALDRLLGGAGFLLFLIMAPLLAVFAGRDLPMEALLDVPWRVWLIVGGVASVVLFIVHRQHRRKEISALTALLGTFRTASRELFGAPRRTALAVLVSFLAHICTNSMLLLCLQAVTREPFSLAALLWTFPIISLISSAPMTFAGTGLREGAALVLLGLYGIPAADAVAASLLVLLIYFIWAGFAGLVFWKGEQQFRRAPRWQVPRTISVVIPTLNEAEALPETVRRARQVPEVQEVIVVDGASRDATAEIARALGCTVLVSPPGRGQQLRIGAKAAHGDVILLLHADTWLPPHAGSALLACLRDLSVVGGGFWKSFRDASWLMAGSRIRCLLRLYLGGRIAGDQALFLRREVLDQIGGVPAMPLMEEFELCKRLRSHGRLALAGATVSTSARRFARFGIFRTYWRMWMVTFQYYRGVPAQKLQRTYEKE